MKNKIICFLFFAILAIAFFSLPVFDSSTTLYKHGKIPFVKTEEVEPRVAKIVFSGDVFLGRDVERIATKYGYQYPLEIFTELGEATATIINFEGSIPQKHISVPSKGMKFSIASTSASSLQLSGVTHAGLANNHSYDYGISAYLNTKNILSKNHVFPFGHPYLVDENSVTELDTPYGKVAIIALHNLYKTPSASDVNKAFSTASPEAKFRIAYIHWGEEYSSTPSLSQKKLARKLVEEANVDLLIGHHPHVVQSINVINGVPIIYSLGNTVFDQYFSSEVQNGLLVKLILTTGEPNKLKLFPISSIGSRTKPYLMPKKESEDFLQKLSVISDTKLREQIISKEIVW